MYGSGDVTAQGNRTYFRSVYMFLEAAKDRAKVTSPRAVRKGLGGCLQGMASTWFIHHLTQEKRDWIRRGKNLDRWDEVLRAKFKISSTKAMKLLDQESFDLDSVKKGRSVAEYILTVVRLARETETYNERGGLEQA